MRIWGKCDGRINRRGDFSSWISCSLQNKFDISKMPFWPKQVTLALNGDLYWESSQHWSQVSILQIFPLLICLQLYLHFLQPSKLVTFFTKCQFWAKPVTLALNRDHSPQNWSHVSTRSAVGHTFGHAAPLNATSAQSELPPQIFAISAKLGGLGQTLCRCYEIINCTVSTNFEFC